ncbi:MAG: ATP-binding cassette domain-containing protein [Gammaproteobacteria bacterium]|nr:ATP-binding cassette domain-containing protein [Gammaproteobacteria bacterium]
MNDELVVLHANAVSKSFNQGDLSVDVLQDINFSVKAGQTHAIMGASGSGKSTLMHILGGLDHVSSGDITICNQPVKQLSAKQLGDVRNKHLGFMYQFHHLLAEFNALENVAMPLLIRGIGFDEAMSIAQKMVEDVGLGHREQHKPGELSGGERQRIALARALVTQPDCVLADEPTGNLDHKTANQVMDMMMELNDRIKTALIIVTHDPELAKRMQQQWVLMDSKLKPN